jgi:hypothetical protein
MNFWQRLCGLRGHDVTFVSNNFSEHGVGVLVHSHCQLCHWPVRYVSVERHPDARIDVNNAKD